MTKPYGLSDSFPGNIYQLIILQLCALCLSTNVYKYGRSNSFSLVGRGYVDNTDNGPFSFSQQGLNKRNFLC
jgi:hypothetical protein